jgi:hypothetical protein
MEGCIVGQKCKINKEGREEIGGANNTCNLIYI